jgi:aryl-alcohol dehydrogenase-like predicted oxidoreductase
MELTTVGFGAWAIGGGDWKFGWGPQDDEDSIATIRYAVERGINWIDTAAVYGLGRSEEIVRRALDEVPATERPYVFTKCGMVWDDSDRMAPPRQVLRPESIRRECEVSLRRLGIERIDLYQFHWPDETGVAVEDSWTEMVRLVDEGKVRAAGVSNFDVPLLERCEAIRHVDSLQPPFSLIRRRAAAQEIPWCATHGTGVIVYSPMQSGLLTDRFSAERMKAMSADDWRRRAPDFNPPRLGRNLALRDALRPGLACLCNSRVAPHGPKSLKLHRPPLPSMSRTHRAPPEKMVPRRYHDKANPSATMAFRPRYLRTKAWIHECCLGSAQHFRYWWHLGHLRRCAALPPSARFGQSAKAIRYPRK